MHLQIPAKISFSVARTYVTLFVFINIYIYPIFESTQGIYKIYSYIINKVVCILKKIYYFV